MAESQRARSCSMPLNTLRPRQNGRHFPDDIFKCIFLNENVWIFIKISLFFPKGRINNIPALVQIMAWCLRGDKPLSEPMMVSLPMHTCVTLPQWVNADIMWDKVLWTNTGYPMKYMYSFDAFILFWLYYHLVVILITFFYILRVYFCHWSNHAIVPVAVK